MNSHLNDAFTTELEPNVFYLGQNYPNPFREKTIIKFCVASATRVTLTVYNEEGKEVVILVDEEKNPGTYEIEFCVVQDSCPVKSSKTYYYHLVAGDYKCEKKMNLIK